MGNLFYNVLGGTTHNSNYDLFSNVQSDYYWSITRNADDPLRRSSWRFNMGSGRQDIGSNLGGGYAWAVQSGDVSPIPVPAAVWLFSSGLIGLIGVARRPPYISDGGLFLNKER